MGAARESNSFIQGCTSLCINCVQAHNDSIVHKASVVENELHNKHVSDTAIGKGFHKMNAEAVEKLSKLFITCHGLTMKSRPFPDFT